MNCGGSNRKEGGGGGGVGEGGTSIALVLYMQVG